MTRPIEGRCCGHSRTSDGGRTVCWHFGKDEIAIVDMIQKGFRYALAIVPIGDDETKHPQLTEEGGSSEEIGRETKPASDKPPARVPQDRIVKKAVFATNHPPFQGWCVDKYAGGRKIPNPIERMEFAKKCIYEVCGVTSRAFLREGTELGEAFKRMWADFEIENRVPDDWGEP